MQKNRARERVSTEFRVATNIDRQFEKGQFDFAERDLLLSKSLSKSSPNSLFDLLSSRRRGNPELLLEASMTIDRQLSISGLRQLIFSLARLNALAAIEVITVASQLD
jgi:hypothetical protein